MKPPQLVAADVRRRTRLPVAAIRLLTSAATARRNYPGELGMAPIEHPACEKSSMSSRLLRRLLVLWLGLASVAGSALAATTGPVAIELKTANLACGDTLNIHPPDSTAAAPDPVIDRLIDFHQYRFGVPPPDFDYETAGPLAETSGSGRPSWRTFVDPSAPVPKMVLIQSPVQARAKDFPMAVLRDVTAENVNLAVSFKLLGGDTARSAGLMWRAQNTNDCRSVLVSALHREIRLLSMENGRTAELARATATFDEKDWSFLEVSVQGDRVTVWLNERNALEARDATPATSGRVGLITRGDTVALFDDFHVQNGQERIVRKTRLAPVLPPAPVLHVTDILTTEADFKTPCRSFRPGAQIRWRVHVADAREKPRAAVIIECELVSPVGKALDRDKAMTGTDGVSLFTRALAKDAAPGVYTIRVSGITHADLPEATYSARANLKSAAPFVVRP